MVFLCIGGSNCHFFFLLINDLHSIKVLCVEITSYPLVTFTLTPADDETRSKNGILKGKSKTSGKLCHLLKLFAEMAVLKLLAFYCCKPRQRSDKPRSN